MKLFYNGREVQITGIRTVGDEELVSARYLPAGHCLDGCEVETYAVDITDDGGNTVDPESLKADITS